MDFLNNPWIFLVVSGIVGPIIVYQLTEGRKRNNNQGGGGQTRQARKPKKGRSIMFIAFIAFIYMLTLIYITVAGLSVVGQ